MAPPVVDEDMDTTTAPAAQTKPSSSDSGNGDVILLRVKRRREEPAPELLYVEAAAGDARGNRKKRRGRLAGLVEGMAALGTEAQTEQKQEQRQMRLFAFARVGTLTAAAAAEADAGRGVTVGGGKRQAAAGGPYREVRRLRCLGGQQGEELARRTHIIELTRPATLLAAAAKAQEVRVQRQQQSQQPPPQPRRPHYIFRPLERELDEAIGTYVLCVYTCVCVSVCMHASGSRLNPGIIITLTMQHQHAGAALVGRAEDGTAARVLECVAQGADIDHQVCVVVVER